MLVGPGFTAETLAPKTHAALEVHARTTIVFPEDAFYDRGA